MSKRALIVVTKRAIPNGSKTRLSPPLSAQDAADLSECFLLDMLDMAGTFVQTEKILAVWPPQSTAHFKALAPAFRVTAQRGENLGERLNHALNECLAEGYDQVILMDSDSPTLPPDRLQSAFNQLDAGAEMVIGPCLDGGYYLIGLTRPAPRLFLEVPMSTPQVAGQTLLLAGEMGLRSVSLAPWYDVDTPDDLLRLQFELRNTPLACAPRTRLFLQERGLR